MVANIPTTKRLSDLKPGFSGEVAAFSNEFVAGKLMTMGILPGTRLVLVREAPFGGGWYVKIGNYSIALRKQEAACIIMN
ncbi:MAG: hypothetical protein DHS20C18_35260 [Saprospiraceae bacterium]|nr:MAG: hypothetical protein DHS20C18_35260 [Saprospiraceae bacterium]